MVRVTEATRTDTRRRLLDAAAVAFAEDGLEGANVNHISIAAGFAKGTVYNYFDSKRSLFEAVIDDIFERVIQVGSEVPASAATRDRLMRLVRADVEWARNNPALARILVRQTMSCSPGDYAQMAGAASPYLEQVTKILEDGRARDEIRADGSVTEMGLVFVGLGVLALAQHFGSGGAWPPMDDIPELVITVFLDGFGLPAPRGGVVS